MVRLIAVVVLFLLFIVSRNLGLGMLPYIFILSALLTLAWPFLKSKSGGGGNSNSPDDKR